VASRSITKPFYFKPPWNILFDIQKLDKVRPWDVRISFLLSSFLEELNARKEIDFRASGIALDSSATIYLMKSKLLLELEEPPPSIEMRPEFLPPPMILPLRYELTTTTIRNLLEALDEALKSEKVLAMKPQAEPMSTPPPEIFPILSTYLVEIEEEIANLLFKIHKCIEAGELVTYSKLVLGHEILERMKTFIIILFMAQRRVVNIWQDENFGEIYIAPHGGE